MNRTASRFSNSLFSFKVYLRKFRQLFLPSLQPLPRKSGKLEYIRRQWLFRDIGVDLVSRAMSIKPPLAVRHMTQLDRSCFATTAAVPTLQIPTTCVKEILQHFKKHLLKMPQIKPVALLEEASPLHSSHRLLLLDPDARGAADTFTPSDIALLSEYDVNLDRDLTTSKLDLGYDNFKSDDILSAVISPNDDIPAVSGFSLIGHIAHFNLRDEHLPYKSLIGQVILDKVPQVKTVVNKLNTIDTTFRYFQMEVLAGEKNFITSCKEHGVTFEMDFSKVYWNPRLSTEHQRIVSQVDPGTVVFDVFAGIGPFAIPAAKKGCSVHANDLNPESYKWLNSNARKNKVLGEKFRAYNLDGRAFIRQVLATELCKLIKEPQQKPVLVVMNLPALALEFLDAFNGLLAESGLQDAVSLLPSVRCYCFDNASDSTLQERMRRALGDDLKDNVKVRFVRNVAPKKDMYCVEFVLPQHVLFGDGEEPATKRPKPEDPTSTDSFSSP